MTTQTQISSSSSRKVKVAVVLPVYNTSRYLPECLDSLANQTYKDFVVFAVNDGSTDQSGEILNQYAQKDKRFIVIHKANAGVSSARNVALDAISKNGKFDFIGFVDSDDIVVETFLETFVSVALEENADYCICGYSSFNIEKTLKSGVVQHGRISLDYISSIKHYCQIDEWGKLPSNLCMTTRFFKTSLIGTERFNQSLFATEDQDFILRVLRRLNKGVLIPDVLYLYRQRASSLSHSESANTVSSSFLLAKSLLNDNHFPQEVRKGLELRICDCWWQEARRVYVNGHIQERKIVKNMLQYLRQHCNLKTLPSKYRKRFFIFACGDFVTSLYFKLLEKKKKRVSLFE